MQWRHRLAARLKPHASQGPQIAWLMFAVLAVSLAVPGIPRYRDLLRTPCDGAGCFAAQLSTQATQAWVAASVDLDVYAVTQVFVLLLLDALLLSTSGFLMWRKPDQRVAVLAAFVATALATSTLSQALAATDPRFRLPVHGILFVQMAGLLPLVCLFPDGRFQPRWMRWVAFAYVLTSVMYLLPRTRAWLASDGSGRSVWLGFVVISVLIVLGVVVDRVCNPTSSTQQEQMRWVLAGIGLAALSMFFSTPLRLAGFSLVSLQMMLPASYGSMVIIGMLLAVGGCTCLLVALINDEPLDTGVLISRTLVYAALSAFVIGAYGVIVGYLSTLFRSNSVVFSLVATGLVAILFHPLRDRLQRAVNRLMYGERDEPYRVLTRLGQQLEGAIEPASALSLTVETIAHALRLPYVAITLISDGNRQPVAAYGALREEVARFPLIYAGETLGELVAAWRAPNESLSPADHQLLSDLARQIGITAHATLLAGDLERARLRIVAAHEETRRRLGSDLHDGVGHELAGLTRQVELARHLLDRDLLAARALLADITRHLNGTSAQVRGLAHQLHPPELELLGLSGALRERAQMHGQLMIRIDAPDTLPLLPTAIETAAYFIALEALTNIEKHSGARACHLRLALINVDTAARTPTLELDIMDDGRGLPVDRPTGLGVLSMQARPAEVGGTCHIASTLQSGTRVSVRLPYPAPLE